MRTSLLLFLALAGAAIVSPGCGGKVVVDAGEAADAGAANASGCSDTSSDPDNCGRCGRSCLGAACSEGLCAPTVLASGQSDPGSIAVDATAAYWTSNAAGSVRSVAIGGGEWVELASGQQLPRAVAVNSKGVYWIVNNTAVATIGFGSSAVGALAGGMDGPIGMAVDETNLYFARDLTLARLPLAGGGSPTTLAQASPIGIALDATNVYWTDCSISKVMKLALAGGAPVALASGQACPDDLAVGGTYVVWSDYVPNGPPEVKAAPIAGGAALVLGSGTGPIAADHDTVYFATETGLMRASLGGGAAVALAVDQSPAGLAVDAAYVYWTNKESAPGAGDGSVRRAPK